MSQLSMETALSTFRGDPSPRNAAEIEAYLEKNIEDLANLATADEFKIKLVTELFSVFQSSRANDRCRNMAEYIVPKIVATPKFFESVFEAIVAAEPARATLLLKLVYEALFSILPSSSTLVAKFVEVVVAQIAKLDAENGALALLVGAQFLSFVDPDDSYLFDERTVEVIKAAKLPPVVLLAWGIALSKLVGTDIPKHLQFGGHSDGLRHKSREIVSLALDQGAVPQIISIASILPSDIQYAHTMSSLLHTLVLVTQMSQTLANAVAAVLEPFPQVSAAFWDEQTTRVLYLTRAKMPASIATFQSLARSWPAPFELMQTLDSYMDFVDPSHLEESQDGCSVLANDTVVFPPRASDNQGGVTFKRGFRGTVINESAMGALMQWKLEYNGWSLIGRVLETAVEQRVWDPTALASLMLIKKTLSMVDGQQARELMGMLSAALGENDIVQLLFGQLEALLSADFEQIGLVLVILEFLVALSQLWPERVWALLETSYLIERYGEGGYMVTIIGAVEVLKNDFSFTTNMLEVIKNVLRVAPASSTRNKLVQHVLDVFESFYYWSYTDYAQRDAIMSHCLEIFNAEPQTLELFLAPSKSRLVQPFIDVLEKGSPQVVLASLELSARLVGQRGAKPYSLLERELFAASSKLVKLTANSSLKAAVFNVLEVLISADSPEQPSLLAYLGAETLTLLSALKGAVSDDAELDSTLVAACRLFSASATSKQEGLRVLLMTGKDLKQGSTEGSLFACVQEKIIDAHEYLSYETLGALLAAVAAQTQAKTHKPELVKVLLERVKDAYALKFDDSLSTCYFVHGVASCASILSQLYFEDPANKEIAAFLGEIKLSEYLTKFFVVHKYNFELHASMHRTLHEGERAVALGQSGALSAPHSVPHSALTPPLKLVSPNPFETARFPTYSDQFVYLSHSPLAEDANHNLCFVHAQAQLIKSWGQFVSGVVMCDAKLGPNRDSQQVVRACLGAISAREISTPFFRDIIQERVGLAFFVLFKAEAPEFDLEVVQAAHALLLNEFVGMSASISQGPGAPKFYKLLLRILCLEVELLAQSKTSAPSTAGAAAELVKSVVVDQLPAVVREAYQDPKGAAEDLQCLVVLLRHSLSVKELPLDTNLSASLARLYSGKLEGDLQRPVLAQLCLVYILEWLRADTAWHFLASGTIQTLLDAPLSELIVSGSITAQQQRDLHSIWVTLLKVMLQVHEALGARASVASTLFEERFKAQMQTCFRQWTTSEGRICGALVEETRLVVMFLKLTSKNHDAAIEQQDELVQAIDHLSSHRKYLATRMAGEDVEGMVKDMAQLRKILV